MKNPLTPLRHPLPPLPPLPPVRHSLISPPVYHHSITSRLPPPPVRNSVTSPPNTPHFASCPDGLTPPPPLPPVPSPCPSLPPLPSPSPVGDVVYIRCDDSLVRYRLRSSSDRIELHSGRILAWTLGVRFEYKNLCCWKSVVAVSGQPSGTVWIYYPTRDG
eukprot:GHVS01023593.1.p1 GENE.GHVS01023593.1~~GHVS01023593.1.p1  ORF type:complete len:161 (+),score=45.71 GHVS01023593.1:43-525(+)